jgi:hypothetical protein
MNEGRVGAMRTNKMKIQLLTFVTEGFSKPALSDKSELLTLAVSEFEGVVRASPIVDVERGVFGEVLVWEDEEALARFRHSELYARLAMDPHLEELVDEEFSVAAGSALAAMPELLAA